MQKLVKCSPNHSHTAPEPRKPSSNIRCYPVRHPTPPVDALRLPKALNSTPHIPRLLLAVSHCAEVRYYFLTLIPKHPTHDPQRPLEHLQPLIHLPQLQQCNANVGLRGGSLFTLRSQRLAKDPKRLLEHPKRILKLALATVDGANVCEELALQRIPLGMVPTHNRKPFLVPRKRLRKHAFICVHHSQVGKRYCDIIVIRPQSPTSDVEHLLLHRKRFRYPALSMQD
mmetsp:Transcript_35919/g.90470  ORF Transcript_35919/g.90470 Transcript_35919/m.90470 type:complete len:227 (+) Transcript_35919:206-886(+)